MTNTARFIPHFTTAYILATLRSIRTLPVGVFVLFLIASISIATYATYTPAILESYRLTMSQQSLQDYERFLRYTTSHGDMETSARVFEMLAPAVDQLSEEKRSFFYRSVYAREYTGEIESFWSEIAQQQPNAREVVAALTITSYQLLNHDLFTIYLNQWKKIEPNDPRLAAFTSQ